MNINFPSSSSVTPPDNGEQELPEIKDAVSPQVQVRTLQEKLENLSQVSLPEMPLEIPLKSETSMVLPLMGEKILQMGEQPALKKELLSDTLSTPAVAVDYSTDLTAKIVDVVKDQGSLSQVSKTNLGLAAAGIEDASAALKIGVLSLQISEKNEIIKQTKIALAGNREKMDSLSKDITEAQQQQNSSQASHLEKSKSDLQEEMVKLEQTLKFAEEEKQGLVSSLVTNSVKSGLGTLKQATEYAAQLQEARESLGTHMGMEALPMASSLGGGILSALNIGLSSNALIENRILAQLITAEKEMIKMEQDNHKGHKFMEAILELRMRNLDQQYEKNAINIVQSSLSLSAGMLGTAVVVKGAAVAAGATVCSTVGGAVAISGVGAVTLGFGPLLLGLAYLAIKNKEAIENSLENASIASRLYLAEKGIVLNPMKTELEKVQELTDKISVFNKLDEFFQNKIAEIQESMRVHKMEKQFIEEEEVNLFTRVPALLHMKIVEYQIESEEKELKELAIKRTENENQKIEVETALKAIYKERLMPLNETSRKVLAKTEQFNLLEKRKKDINDAYLYGKDIAKFNVGVSTEEMTWQKLEQVHNLLFHEGNAEGFEKMHKVFSAQNQRLKSDVDLSSLQEGVSKDKLWEVTLQCCTAPVK